MSPVSRLKKTWSKAKTAKFFILEVNTAIHCLRSKRREKLDADGVFACCHLLLTASDGSDWKLLQLQDCPEGGRPPLSDCQQ